jgi:hypothetical protein
MAHLACAICTHRAWKRQGAIPAINSSGRHCCWSAVASADAGFGSWFLHGVPQSLACEGMLMGVISLLEAAERSREQVCDENEGDANEIDGDCEDRDC